MNDSGANLFTIKPDDEHVRIGINVVRMTFGNENRALPSLYALQGKDYEIDVLEGLFGEIGHTDILGWALNLKDDRGKPLVWVRPKPGSTEGRLSWTFLELAALVRGLDQCQDLLSESKKQLIRSLTIGKESHFRLYLDKPNDEECEIIALPIRIDIGKTEAIPFHIPRAISGLKGRGKESLVQSSGFIEKRFLQDCGLLGTDGLPTDRAKVLVDAVESWLLYEYSLVNGIEGIEDKLSAPLVMAILVLMERKITRKQLADVLGIDTAMVDGLLSPVLSHIGIDRWTWSGNELVCITSPEGESLIYLEDSHSLWHFLKPGSVVFDIENLGKWAPAPAMTPQIYEEWSSNGPKPISVLLGRVGSGKTIALGSMALEWLDAGGRVATINAGRQVPEQPTDKDLLVIVDDADRLPRDFLVGLMNSWQMPERAKLVLTMRAELFELLFSDLRKRAQLPGSDHWKTIMIPEWTQEQLNDIVDNFTEYNPVASELIEKCREWTREESRPLAIASYLKDAFANALIFNNPSNPPYALQLKFLRLLADMLVEDGPIPNWRDDWSKAVFDTLCSILLSRCRTTDDIVNALMQEHLGPNVPERPFPSLMLDVHLQGGGYYLMPAWQAVFSIPPSQFSEAADDSFVIGIDAIALFHKGGRVSFLELKRLTFLVEEFRLRRSDKWRNGQTKLLYKVTKRLLKDSPPGSQTWNWAIHALHGMPDEDFNAFKLFPKGTWTAKGIQRWTKELDDGAFLGVLQLLMLCAQESSMFRRIKPAQVLYEKAALVASYAPASASNYRVAALEGYASFVYGEDNDVEKGMMLYEAALQYARDAPNDTIEPYWTPSIMTSIAGIHVDLGQFEQAEGLVRSALLHYKEDEENPEIRRTMATTWLILSRALGYTQRFEDAYYAIQKAVESLPFDPLDQNLPGMIFRLKGELEEIFEKDSEAAVSKKKAIEFYRKASDIEQAVRALKEAEEDAIANCDFDTARQLTNERMQLTAFESHKMLIGSDERRRDQVSRLQRARLRRDIPELIRILEEIIMDERGAPEIILTVAPEYTALLRERERYDDSARAGLKVLEAARELKDIFYEGILLQGLLTTLSRAGLQKELNEVMVDLYAYEMTFSRWKAANTIETILRLMKRQGLKQIQGFRGKITRDGDSVDFEPCIPFIE